MTKLLQFFAVEDDLLQVLLDVGSIMPLQVVPRQAAGIASKDASMSSVELPPLGVATNESAVNSAAFRMAERSTIIRSRPVQLNSGEIHFLIDQLENPDTVVLRPGGVWDSAVVLYGSAGTASDSAASKGLMKALERGLRKHFKKVGPYWVGPKAFVMLREGKRLTIAAQSPRDFDLALSDG
jgi:hypothetical protein